MQLNNADFDKFPRPPTKIEIVKVPLECSMIRQKMPNFQFSGKLDPLTLAYTLLDSMRAANGIGLSANQIGIEARVFVLATISPLACFNPKIVNFSDQKIREPEGCLSYPGLQLMVSRSTEIRVRYQDIAGEFKTLNLTGLAAKAFQHELDHLDGITMFDRIHKLNRESAMKKWRKIKKNATATNS